jgi:hypothetical protein
MSRAEVESAPSAGEHRSVWRVLDLAFGFFAWATHFLVIYIATSVSCVLGLGAAGDAVRVGYPTALALFTAGAAAVVLAHGFRRYAALRGPPDQRFRLTVTLGCDAIATVAIATQLLPLLLVPLCA